MVHDLDRLAGALGAFDRQEILRVLFDRDAVRLRNPGMPTVGVNDEQGVYLLGWANQPTTAAVTKPTASTGRKAPRSIPGVVTRSKVS